MKWPKKLNEHWRSASVGAALCTGLGLLSLLWFHELVLLGYDLLFLFRGGSQLNEVVIVYMDERAFQEFQQTSAPNWDRNLHARLLDRLASDQARLVVFDIVFSETNTPAANTNLARAMQRQGTVMLAAALDPIFRPQIHMKTSVMPRPEFLEAAAGWGITEVMSPDKGVERQYYVGTETQPSLPWAAATLAGAEMTRSPGAREPETWLNYYGPALTLPHWSYGDVFRQPAGYFRDKFVFVGARPKTLKAREEADAFSTPYTRWTGQFTPGVEITATAFVNLLRHDGLRLWPWSKQIWLVLASGLVLGAAFSLLRPWTASGLAVLVAAVCLGAALAAARHHVWFNWTVVAFAQVPCALAWSIRGQFHRLKVDKEVLERTLVETTRFMEASKSATAQKKGVGIPDHTLVRMVGKGAYGQVWLARNAIGVYHAVKIVQRRFFPADAPYEREFRGIRKFMPISRSHPGLVHVLHAGRNDEEGFFFYIMEAGDDEMTGQSINPDRYVPKTLASELERRGTLPPEECLQLGLALTLALEHLHQQQLIHRDIKPANIIYVNGAPKFADIGLVTDLGGDGRNVSMLGTEGYIAPEGPGSAGADVYALGKVLYEASMGRDRRLFPEVPTAVLEQSSGALIQHLQQVIFRACASQPEERYQAARAMHADLLELQNLIQQRSP